MALESEIEIYAQITDFSGLEQATAIELQLQGEIKIPVEGGEPIRQRVRATTPAPDLLNNAKQIAKYELTCKTAIQESNGIRSMMEDTTEIERTFGNWFLRNVAKNIIVKKRFKFPSREVKIETENGAIVLPEVIFEVDVFSNGDWTKPCPICKIDIEMDPVLNYLKEHHPDLTNIATKIKVSHLPFKPEHITPVLNEDESIKEKVKQFWAARSIPASQYFGE